MPLFLKNRDEHIKELMDSPGCDQVLLHRTYRQFTTINKLLSGWGFLYETFIKPILIEKSGQASILDIGCGGGDVIRYLNGRANDDGLNVSFTGIDPDQRSIDFVSTLEWPENISFLPISSNRLNGETYDIVISNHLIHHLTDDEIVSICQDAERLSSHLVLFNDIERSDIGYLSFSLIAPLLFRKSFIVADGKVSVKRSFRKNELQQIVPPRWDVSRKFPFRLIATYNRRKSE